MLRSEIADNRVAARADNAALRTEFATETAALRAELSAQISENRGAITDVRVELAGIKAVLDVRGVPALNKTASVDMAAGGRQ